MGIPLVVARSDIGARSIRLSTDGSDRWQFEDRSAPSSTDASRSTWVVGFDQTLPVAPDGAALPRRSFALSLQRLGHAATTNPINLRTLALAAVRWSVGDTRPCSGSPASAMVERGCPARPSGRCGGVVHHRPTSSRGLSGTLPPWLAAPSTSWAVAPGWAIRTGSTAAEDGGDLVAADRCAAD